MTNDSKMQAAIIAAFTAIIGWFVLHFLTQRRDTQSKKADASLRFLQRQIEELYGPMLGLIQQSRAVYEVAVQKLPNENGRVNMSRFSSADGKVWNFFVENYFLPINREITTLLRTKLFLLEAGYFPPSFQNFSAHSAQFDCLYQLWKNTGVDSSSIKGTGWPTDFEENVQATLKTLRERHQKLVSNLQTQTPVPKIA